MREAGEVRDGGTIIYQAGIHPSHLSHLPVGVELQQGTQYPLKLSLVALGDSTNPAKNE